MPDDTPKPEGMKSTVKRLLKPQMSLERTLEYLTEPQPLTQEMLDARNEKYQKLHNGEETLYGGVSHIDTIFDQGSHAVGVAGGGLSYDKDPVMAFTFLKGKGAKIDPDVLNRHLKNSDYSDEQKKMIKDLF